MNHVQRDISVMDGKMTSGNRICAACGSDTAVQAHHLVPRVYGGGELPTVWLCHVCHGVAHSSQRSADHRVLTKAGLAAAKARGVSLGGYKGGPVPDVALSVKARQQAAEEFAARVGPIILALRNAGLSLRQIATHMVGKGISTAQGGAWSATAVKNVLDRIATGNSGALESQ